MKGTNYIDHRYPCLGMVKHVWFYDTHAALTDIHGNLLYLIIQD